MLGPNFCLTKLSNKYFEIKIVIRILQCTVVLSLTQLGEYLILRLSLPQNTLGW